jgi:hypothetical protein
MTDCCQGCKIVRKLITCNADINAADSKGKTALHYAAASSSYTAVQSVQIIIGDNYEKGTSNTSWFGSGLASVAGVAAAIALAPVPLTWSVLLMSTAASFVGLKNGLSLGEKIRINAKDNDGKTALHHAAESLSRTATESVDALLKNGATLNEEDHRGKTALHCAAEVLSANVIKSLVAMGASDRRKDKFGDTPLGRANERVNEKFDSGPDVKIGKLLKAHQIPWLTLDMLPLPKLPSPEAPSYATLEIGLDIAPAHINQLSDVRDAVLDLIQHTHLNGLVEVSMFDVELSLSTKPSTPRCVSLPDRDGVVGLKGTLGGLLGKESGGNFIALTCCHVLRQESDAGPLHATSTLVEVLLGDHVAHCFEQRIKLPWDTNGEIVDWALIEFKDSQISMGKVRVP